MGNVRENDLKMAKSGKATRKSQQKWGKFDKNIKQKIDKMVKK